MPCWGHSDAGDMVTLRTCDSRDMVMLGTWRSWEHEGATDMALLGTRQCWGHDDSGDMEVLRTLRYWGHGGPGDMVMLEDMVILGTWRCSGTW